MRQRIWLPACARDDVIYSRRLPPLSVTPAKAGAQTRLKWVSPFHVARKSLRPAFWFRAWIWFWYRSPWKHPFPTTR